MIIELNGKHFAVADRCSASILLHSQATGRWSQLSPPAAQWPKKMRKLIGLETGWNELSYDYDGIEGNIIATITGDEVLLGAVHNGWSLHTLNACDLFNMEHPPVKSKRCFVDEGCAEWREKYNFSGEEDPRYKFAKVFFYRVLYRGSPKSGYKIPGANKLGMSRDELTAAGERWVAAHHKIEQFWRECDEDSIGRGLSRTLSGRRRVLTSLDEGARAREGTNYRMQALVTTVVNRTVDLTRKIDPERIHLLAQMHDSLKFAISVDGYEGLRDKAIEVAQRPVEYGGVKFDFKISWEERTN